MKVTLSSEDQVRDVVYPCLMWGTAADDEDLLIILYTAPDKGIVVYVYDSTAWKVGDEVGRSTGTTPFKGSITMTND